MRGGYFIEHLRQEGRILNDPDDALAHRLSTARIKVSYIEEIEQARRLLGLLEFIPATQSGAAWALDVLMVAVRSFGYAVLADRGIFVFNYGQMLRRLASIGFLSREASQRLVALRLWKVRYRSGHTAVSWDTLLPLVKEADQLMKLGIHVQQTPTSQYVERAAKGHYAHYGWYARTRLLEVIGNCVPGVLPAKLNSVLRAPQEYGRVLSCLNVENWIRRALDEMQRSNNIPYEAEKGRES